MKATGGMEDVKIDVKLKISSLWIALLFIFAYVDIFSFFRSDILKGALAGKAADFSIDQTFLFLTTLYVSIPCAMVFLSLVLAPKANRWTNLVLGTAYLVSILLGCIGEVWAYYLFGSLVECLLIAMIVWYAWIWPRQEGQR